MTTLRVFAPPRRQTRASLINAKLNPMQNRAVYSAGADQVLARPPPKLYVTVSLPTRVAFHPGPISV